ncbi:MAG: hypothetical protein V4722_01145 [Bacteroidota bacterium]
MSQTIPLRFKLDSLTKIGFSTASQDMLLQEELKLYLDDGIEINQNFYDDLFNDTVTNGHNLLKCGGIFELETTVVESMAVVIGKFLFRLLFTNAAAFRERLHQAKKTESKIEITLEFDVKNKDSKLLSQLPWELMYCPDSQPGSANAVNQNDDDISPEGFFLSREAVVCREYKKYGADTKGNLGKVTVAVAFLTKNTDNLLRFYDELKIIANGLKKDNIQFEFINEWNGNGFELLTKSQMDKIFLKDKKYDGSDKIIHIICDVDTTQYKTGDSRAFYFKKYGAEIENIAFEEIYSYLENYSVLPDTGLKLLVLQAWKDSRKYDYVGFEEFASQVIKRNKENQTAIITMPYVLKQATSKQEMNPVFFETLYTALAASASITDVVKKVRNQIVPQYSYGFPVFYYAGGDPVLVSDKPVAMALINQPGFSDKNVGLDNQRTREIKHLLRYVGNDHLLNLEKELKAKLADPSKEMQEQKPKTEIRLQALATIKRERMEAK